LDGVRIANPSQEANLEMAVEDYVYQRDDAAQRPVLLDPTKRRGHLLDPNDWEEPSARRPEILVGATDLGERRYYRPAS
jgi:hypothetical protein